MQVIVCTASAVAQNHSATTPLWSLLNNCGVLTPESSPSSAQPTVCWRPELVGVSVELNVLTYGLKRPVSAVGHQYRGDHWGAPL